jgi:hypothetical protein
VEGADFDVLLEAVPAGTSGDTVAGTTLTGETMNTETVVVITTIAGGLF